MPFSGRLGLLCGCLVWFGCGTRTSRRYAATELEMIGGVEAEMMVCDFSIDRKKIALGEDVTFRIRLPGSRQRRLLCLSYLQDRPFRWTRKNPEGANWCESNTILVNEHPGYAGTPVFVTIPDGGYVTICGKIPGANFRKPGKYRINLVIIHMRFAEDDPGDWPENDEGAWRGVIKAKELQRLEVLPKEGG